MKSLFFNRISAVWLVLVLATVLAYAMGGGMGIQDARLAGAAIVVVSLVKIRFVIFEFMELREAPRGMRWVANVWLVAMGAILVALLLRTVA
ncbi:cytochrome C oxidase subunit IV family protein (plasmid) [Diaphorobacter sp. HDW4B]|uniref:cytochrome C oxidase subunit IV family protein n=1 Tax=Diaphorobacter sp. HDW4B TaxID=2714925 RepID=UPI00140ACF8C|nr:cytochrome C oxidase subunit IV family protein [Diaphorobacter sp. HDW4B]QIL74020.1 cytochrome C oxidase subunit IV family protein [Diaphorobacter sp. HDW4B]